ncbi:hypothetical protein ABW20_dc0102092 [Dactylellina cionopaga]|nr:hypothetical protein ABW20_dc0102092 [Dactylellina cionopaga]
MSNITEYHNILSSALRPGGDYIWPDLCQNLDVQYTGLNASFQYFNVCTIYPDLVEGLSSGAFDSNRTFIDELLNYRIQPIQNVPKITQDITTETVDFLFRTCFDVKCNDGNGAACDMRLMRGNNGQGLSLEGVNSCRAAICTNLKTYITDDPDIGGVGVRLLLPAVKKRTGIDIFYTVLLMRIQVFISYILQILLVLMITIYVLLKYIFHERRIVPHDKHSPFAGSIAFPQTLLEFQKLQSWFIGSLVIATFIRQLGPNQLSITDFLFLGGISLNGVVLICYMNAALLLLGRKSWYVYSLSCITFLICSGFVLYVNIQRGDRVDVVLPALSFCRSQLIVLDYSDDVNEWVTLISKLPEFVIYIAWGFCALVQIACLFWMMEWDKKASPLTRIWIMTRNGQIILWLSVLGIMLCFLAIFGLQLAMLSRFWGIMDPKQWSLGQIIAVAVWLPIIVDYIHNKYQEKKGRLGQPPGYTKDEEAGYANPHPNLGQGPQGPQGPSGAGSSHASTVTVVQQGTSSGGVIYPRYSDTPHLDSLSDYSYPPPPNIHIDTHGMGGGGPPTISPTIVTQSHFGSPLLPSIPSSPLFSAHQMPGNTPPGAPSAWGRATGHDSFATRLGDGSTTQRNSESQYSDSSGTFGV